MMNPVTAGTMPVATGGSGGAAPLGGTGAGGSPSEPAADAGSRDAGRTPDSGTPASDAGPTDSGAADSGAPDVPDELFSFFVTSLEGLQRLSRSQDGFGGDLRYGQNDGLSGADKICTELAEDSMPGAGAKQWRAFLSVANGPNGQQVDAIDRVGEGPWYDRLGRLVAMTRTDLQNTRPRGADPAIINDLPNEFGVPNQAPDPGAGPVDNHHILTGSNTMGRLEGSDATCSDWTSTARTAGRPRIGFSWPAGNRQHWISGQDEGGCGAGVNLAQTGGSDPNNPIVGSGGGYGGIYCFALTP